LDERSEPVTDVRYRTLGSSGLMVSAVGLGGNNFGSRLDLEETRAVVDAALDVGVNLIDTADVYGNGGGSEALLGEVLKGRRDDVVIATKFGGNMRGAGGADHGARGSRRYIRRAVESSLRRLQTDWIDLYQYHFPDGVTPIQETLAALHELVIEGKVRYAGSSNLHAWQVVEAAWVARRDHVTGFISAQNRWSLIERGAERELVPACRAYGVGILPYFPLASGLLTGKYRRGEKAPDGTRLAGRPERTTDAAFDKVEALEKFAADRGVSLLDVAVGGLTAQAAVGSVIAGATTPEQVRANVDAGGWIPTEEDLRALDDIVPSPRSEG
jgi:aryl-alcohol dehydrogenase-like predicted oxidoreductase